MGGFRFTALVRLGLAAALAGMAGTASGVCAAPDSSGPITFLGDGTDAAAATVAACSRAQERLADHGWSVPALLVRIEANPFDATTVPGQLTLASSAPAADNAFDLTVALVKRSLAAAPKSVPVEALARRVAAGLSMPTEARRCANQREWLARLGRGEVLTTVVPELLWREGGDRAIRAAAAGEWPTTALAVLRNLGCDDPIGAAGELALAALLNPASLGFPPPVPQGPPTLEAVIQSSDVALGLPGARFLVLPAGSGAVGVEQIRSDGDVAAWLAVRYSLTSEYDVLRLGDGHEVAVPLQGVEWAAVVVIGFSRGARVSLNLRAIQDFPQQLGRWDFVATSRAANLTWESESHRGLTAYVVEALARSAEGAWSVRRRLIMPVADDGDVPYGYAFVDPEGGDVTAYRLLALTDDGLLGEISTFPVPGD
jgi:hypothetical protein